MADEATESDFCQTLGIFLPDEEFRAVKALLRESNLEQLVDEKYRDWINSNHLKPADDQDKESRDKEKIDAIFEKLIECSELTTLDEEGHCDKEDMIRFQEQASVIMRICQILLSSMFKDANNTDAGSEVIHPPTYEKFVMKKSTCCMVSLCAANAEEHPWTDPQSRTTAHELLTLICTHCQCSSISELFCGCTEVKSEDTSEDKQTFNTVFPLGLFRHILDYLRPHLLKDTWKKSPMACHVLVWCTMQVKHPYVGDHFPKLMSPLLLFIDDYKVENKVMGLKCLKHVVDNMNSSELQWYGRADVLFEATQRHLYTSEASLVRALHPCLLSILKVLEPPPTKPKFGRKTTKCDTVFQIILTSMEFESKIAMRRACTSHLKDFIEHMGITILRHFKRLLRVVVSYLQISDYPDEEARLSILDALNTTMLHAWPRIPHHSSTILKSLLKLLVDVTDSAPYLKSQAYKQLTAKTSDCLLVLLRCCGKQVKDQLKELTKGVGHRAVEECAANVLKEFDGEKSVSVPSQGEDVT